jgi:endonuclease/exonuclease/phosphatase family metal-dependent hydrolase
MTFNIYHGEGLDGQIDKQRFADLILQENADLVGLQEVDRGTTRVSGRDFIAELAFLRRFQYHAHKRRLCFDDAKMD